MELVVTGTEEFKTY